MSAGAIASLPGLADVRERFMDADAALIAACGLAELASCLSYVPAFQAGAALAALFAAAAWVCPMPRRGES